MAVLGFSDAAIATAVKEVYSPRLRKLFSEAQDTEKTLGITIDKNPDPALNLRIPLKLSRMRSHKASKQEAATYPITAPGKNTYFETEWIRLYQSLNMDGLFMHLTNQQGAAHRFEKWMTAAQEDLLKDRIENCERMFFGDGTGVYGTVTTGATIAAGGVMTVSHPAGLSNSALQYFTDDNGYFIVISSDGTAFRGGFKLQYRDWANNQITVDRAITVQTGDLIVAGPPTAAVDPIAESSYNAEMPGVQTWITSGTLYGVAAGTSPRWTSKIIAAAGAGYNEEYLFSLLRYVGNREATRAGLDLTGCKFVMHQCMETEHRRAYGGGAEYSQGNFSFKRGENEQSIEYHGQNVPVHYAKLCRPDAIYLGDWRVVEKRVAKDWTLDGAAGGTLQRAGTSDAYWMGWKSYQGAFTNSRARLAAITGLSYDADVVAEVNAGV